MKKRSVSTFFETCGKCGKEYKVEEFGVGPSSKELESISCPYCGHSHEKMSAGGFRTFKLESQEEK